MTIKYSSEMVKNNCMKHSKWKDDIRKYILLKNNSDRLQTAIARKLIK